MGWGSFQDALLFLDGQHSSNRSLAKFIEVLHRRSGIFGYVLPLTGEIQKALQTFEKSLVERALIHAEGNKSKAAEVLGIHRRLLYEKMRAFKIDWEFPYGVPVCREQNFDLGNRNPRQLAALFPVLSASRERWNQINPACVSVREIAAPLPL
jgi:hypothetical protein